MTIQFANLPPELRDQLAEALGFTPTPTADLAPLLRQHLQAMRAATNDLLTQARNLQGVTAGLRMRRG
ncbi:hypothetical protein [Allokutzneria sp. NRRL B-24872]|uniref:hypothetical protein n=1 Tax=Allokutzneria sp. NRRL B-24872 TaxID=1137961 RepID=UPI000A3788A5|nr:hypothetical protein [Allokutzneria sp. NRRL B-24872]